jgi:hypothetical protein
MAIFARLVLLISFVGLGLVGGWFFGSNLAPELPDQGDRLVIGLFAFGGALIGAVASRFFSNIVVGKPPKD